MPIGFSVNGSTGAVSGTSFAVLVVPEGMVKGYRGGLVRGIPYVDFEPGFRFWVPGTAGATGSVTLAKVTPGGTDGSLTFADGLISAFVAPT
jgi:hypothetical protein